MRPTVRQYLLEHTDEQDDDRQAFTFKHKPLRKWEDDDLMNKRTARSTIDLARELSAKMHDAVSANGQNIILNPTDQHEVEVLRNQSKKQTRITPPLDLVDARLTVVPPRTPLLLFLDLDRGALDGVVELLALRFLEVVAYLQNSSVAHLDLKPENIVVQRDPESKKVDLAIIDFDTTVFPGTEPTISETWATFIWRAPEFSSGESYNPLLVDRWSCGRVLRFFTGRMKPSRTQETMYLLSQQLMDRNPSLRPPISDLAKLQEMVGAPSPSN